MRSGIILILTVSILYGCASKNIENTLYDIESYIMERPDSALTILDTMDRSMLKSERHRAHHALLYAMALDKNYIDVSDDSLALTAQNFYRNHGPKKNLARSMYYHALSYYYDGQYDKSIVELANAKPIAEKYDSLYLGFIKVLEANIYSTNYNNEAELDALINALKIYTTIKADNYINITKYRLARAYINNEMYTEALDIFNELLNSPSLKEAMTSELMCDYAFTLGTSLTPDYLSSASIYEEINEKNSELMSNQDYWVWAHALSRTGKIYRSRELVNKMKQVDTSCTAYYFLYLIAKQEGKYIEALDYLEDFSDRNKKEVIHILKQSISTVQRDYYQSKYETTEYKAKNRLLIIICITTISLLLTTIITISVIRYKNKKEEEKNEYIRYAEEIIRQLKELQKDSYTSLQKKYISLYKTKYDTVRNLYDKYLQSDGRTDAEHLIYKKVVSIINDVRNDMGNSTNLEKILNEDLNELYTLLYTELPDLSKKDRILIGYLVIGFDVVLISHFMNCTPNSIYIRKSRLKKIIEESNTEHKDVFMEIIG